jgi:hypothetical protein
MVSDEIAVLVPCLVRPYQPADRGAAALVNIGAIVGKDAGTRLTRAHRLEGVPAKNGDRPFALTRALVSVYSALAFVQGASL